MDSAAPTICTWDCCCTHSAHRPLGCYGTLSVSVGRVLTTPGGPCQVRIADASKTLSLPPCHWVSCQSICIAPTQLLAHSPPLIDTRTHTRTTHLHSLTHTHTCASVEFDPWALSLFVDYRHGTHTRNGITEHARYTEKDGEGCVIVALNEWRAAHDMAQDATPEDHIEPENGFSLQRKRRASTTSFPTNPTDIMHVKRRRPALRQRFCSRSNLPVSPEDECDSDDEVDIGWMHRCHAATIDDFTDLSTAEKEVMKLWSGYMLDHPVIADSHVAPVCRAFISELQVKLRPFRNNVMMHIAALRDFAIITLQETAELVAHANATFGT